MSRCTRVFPGVYKSLEDITGFVAEQAAKTGFDSKTIYSIEVAVDEACSNIIEHAYGGENKGTITLTCEVSPGEFIVHIQDQGAPFDPEKVRKPRLDARLSKHPGHGLGYHFMTSMMDEVFFEFNDDGTLLTMIKRTERSS